MAGWSEVSAMRGGIRPGRPPRPGAAAATCKAATACAACRAQEQTGNRRAAKTPQAMGPARTLGAEQSAAASY
jgi:hypothetical protein